MKRLNGLYEKIIEMDNLRIAFDKAKKGKEKRICVQECIAKKDMLLNKLHNMLVKEEYHTSDYKTFTIFEPKERLIYKLPFFPDRILHHAIMNIMEDIWVKSMISSTCACIKGRGIHKCLYDIKKCINANKGKKLYCLKMDIRHFYPSIDHDCLKQAIRKKIKDKRLLSLLDEIICSTNGIPIGNYLSQFFANIFLSDLDHKLKEQLHIKYYYRYADDMIIICESKEQLHDYLIFIMEELKAKKLTIKKNYQIFPIAKGRNDTHGRGLDFIGYVFFMNKIYLRKKMKLNFIRSSKKLKYKHASPDEIKIHSSAWFGWCKHADAKELYNKLIHLNYE